jgi:cobalamin biosynthesis Mg chelatase CobN
VRHFGIDVQASLTLTSTNLDLSKRLTPTGSSQTPTSTTPPSPGSNPSTGPVNGGSGTGPTSGSNPGSGRGPTSGSQQPASNPAQSKPSTQSASLLPWMFGILGIVAAAIVVAGVWIARRRMKKPTVRVPTAQPTI